MMRWQGGKVRISGLLKDSVIWGGSCGEGEGIEEESLFCLALSIALWVVGIYRQ